MRWKGWDHVLINPGTGEVIGSSHDPGILAVDAIAPVIISASRSTDIPALYGEWFMQRLEQGYATWTSPWNGRIQTVSFAGARVLVFWSKNPLPFIPSLTQLIRQDYQVLVLYTLNDYRDERLEPGIPSLEDRIRTFARLSALVGRGRVTWRFDPLLLTRTLSVEKLLDRINAIGDQVAGYTDRLVISFIDIERYPRVKRNLGDSGVRECSPAEIRALARGIAALNEDWGLEVQVCGEELDLSPYGIGRGACISYEILAREFASDRELMAFLAPSKDPVLGEKRRRELKDPGQRSRCGCVVSKDIGQYATCIHGCRYCYATSSAALAQKNYLRYCSDRDRGIFHPGITGQVARGSAGSSQVPVMRGQENTVNTGPMHSSRDS